MRYIQKKTYVAQIVGTQHFTLPYQCRSIPFSIIIKSPLPQYQPVIVLFPIIFTSSLLALIHSPFQNSSNTFTPYHCHFKLK